MAATTVYARSSRYGKAELENAIYCWMGSYDSEEYFDKFYDSLVEKVNNALPDDMVWFPELSEVWCDVDVDHDDIEDFAEYFGEILDKAWDKTLEQLWPFEYFDKAWDEADVEVEAELEKEGRAV